jgi:Uma2 family endonuclease
VLVDKAMGYFESVLAIVLGYFLHDYLTEHNLGVVSGEAGTMRLMPGLVRAPDLCFILWERFPNREIPTVPVPDLGPDLAVEILSQGNTEEEMERKRQEYFAADAHFTWIVDPKTRSVRVYTSPTEFRLLSEEETLDAEPMLPGFRLSIREWFERASRGSGR